MLCKSKTPEETELAIEDAINYAEEEMGIVLQDQNFKLTELECHSVMEYLFSQIIRNDYRHQVNSRIYSRLRFATLF